MNNSASEDVELLGCPFCGGKAEITFDNVVYWAVCESDECGAQLFDVLRPMAVKGWNTRDRSLLAENERLKAREILLSQSLEQSYSTISFLHDCLTTTAIYGYPEQTLGRLKAIEKLITIKRGCVHSYTQAGCESCARRDKMFEERAWAQDILAQAALNAEHPAQG